MWMGSFVRADLAPMREVAVLSLRDARHSPGSPAAGRALHVYGVTCWFQGDYAGARTHLEQALAAYDHECPVSVPASTCEPVSRASSAEVSWLCSKAPPVAHLE